MSKNNQKRTAEITSVFASADEGQELTAMEKAGRFNDLKSDWKKKLLYPFAGVALLALIGMGVMAKNGWLPSTDAMTGKKTGWFGKALPNNASSSWSPLAAPIQTATPQLSKEYIYAGSRMLAVEDANANPVPPADLAVWRPSSGVWWVMGGPGSQQLGLQWGGSGDIPVPGDYDGDGKTDFSVWRPSDGIWYIIRSSSGSNGTSYAFGYGSNGDKPAQADYDGDGKTDAAVYRPNTSSGGLGVWYIQKSSNINEFFSYQFGLSTDLPAAADYDGDGKADIGVWRNSAQTFYSIDSSTGTLRTVPLGQSGDKVTSADFDGDGRADYAVYNTSSANWHIRISTGTSTQTQTVPLSAGGDLPVQNDYDGDGKVDIATWRNSNGNWYIRKSGSNNALRQEQWGQNGDIPVPAFYRR